MATEEKISAGGVIVEEGTPPSDLFILKSGSVGVYMDDTLIEAFNAKDTVVGEMSVILDRPRTATVKARSNCTIVRYHADDLLALVRDHPEVAQIIFQSLAGRLDKANKKIAELTEEARKLIWQD